MAVSEVRELDVAGSGRASQAMERPCALCGMRQESAGMSTGEWHDVIKKDNSG